MRVLFERERERENARDRPAEREDARREFDMPPSLVVRNGKYIALDGVVLPPT